MGSFWSAAVAGSSCGRGVGRCASPPVTEAQRATLAAGGWREVGGEWRHDVYGTARVEAALELAASDAERRKRKRLDTSAMRTMDTRDPYRNLVEHYEIMPQFRVSQNSVRAPLCLRRLPGAAWMTGV